MDTSLHLYARCGRADVARIQLQHGANTEIRDAQGLTPLLLAARYNQLQVLQLLLQHGARTDAFAPLDTDFGHGGELGTCLHFAAESGHVQILKFLVTAAALDPDERTCGSQEITALHLAAWLGRADVVRFLVARAEVDINARDAHGMTALHHACDYPNASSFNSPPQYLFDAAKTLVDHGAYSGMSWWFHKVKVLLSKPLWTRPGRHNWKIRRDSSIWETELVNELEAVNSVGNLTKHHEAALHAACRSKKFRRLRDVLKGQGDIWVNSRVSTGDNVGWTALHIAASSGWQAGVTLLIAHGANVELTTTENEEHGTTAVHLAAQNGHSSIVLALLDAGADVNACDDFSDTPLLRALRHGRSRIVQLLLCYGAQCNFQTESGSQIGSFDPRSTSALHLAAFFGLLSVVQELAETSKSLFAIDAVDDDGGTPLWLAAAMGHLDVVAFLAQQGANTHHHVAGASASKCAAEFGHLEVVEYISTSSPGQVNGWRSLTRLAVQDKTQFRRKSM
ncbi:Ankyrin-3 [Phytophthora citrophthora]|uniref:Ankyrin-3 n=1 Tax=Phytophthora citrophthora TaxID=4793 RepID=A0AAD9FZB7_9STRA|nr:Ankyrin-3 [Phytophthora citrophthora]